MLGFKTVEVIPVEQAPAVVEALGKWTTLRAEAGAAQAEAERWGRILQGLDPAPAEVTERLARRAHEDALDQFHRLDRQARVAEREVEAARAQAKDALDAAQRELRKPAIAAAFAKFLEGVEAHEKVVSFDRQTCAMGGSRVEVPCPSLLREVYEDAYRAAKRDGWVD
ncbi:MAG: hypothetical protein ACRDGM_01705 [bacterium]